MSNNEWVQEGTPRDDAEWTEEADDYGIPVEPAEWDDYSDEQAMPVPPRPVQPEPVSEEPDVIADQPTVEDAPEDEFHVAAPIGDEEATVFADQQPVEAADDDLTQEVAEAIDAEQEVAAEESVAEEAIAEEIAEEVLTEEAPADEVPSVDYDSLEETALVEQIDDEAEEAEEDEATADDGAPGAAGAAIAASAGLVGGLTPKVESAPSPAAMAGLYRTDAEETQVLDTTRRSIEDEAAEEEARAAALRAEKEERDRRLGMVQTSDANAERELRPARRGVGQFGSFGLFVLRLVVAALLGIVAYQVLYSIDATAEFLARQPLIPEPRTVAWVIGFTLAAMAVLLVIGLGVRVVGLVLAVLGGLTLALVRWGSFSPFVDGMEGFLGDKDLLLAAIGVAFFSLGGGRWGIDGAISRARADAREAKRS